MDDFHKNCGYFKKIIFYKFDSIGLNWGRIEQNNVDQNWFQAFLSNDSPKRHYDGLNDWSKSP